MTETEVKKLLEEKRLKWSDFLKFMNGQTVSMKNNETNYYECDVNTFIRGGYRNSAEWD